MPDIEPSQQTNFDTTRDCVHDAALAPVERTIQVTFSQLEACIDQAKSIVPVSDVLQLIDLLPAGSIEAQRFWLSELIKFDMSAAARRATDSLKRSAGDLDIARPTRRLLDFYLPACSQWLTNADVPLDLVLEEMQVRYRFGEAISLTDYCQQYPQWAEALVDMQRDTDQPTRPASRQRPAPTGLPEFEIGQTIDDFRITRTLGRGGFAHVYLAYQQSMQRFVALKVTSHRSEEPQTLSQLDHPNIVRVYDQRSIPSLGIHLLYMQAILGGTLATVVAATRERSVHQLSGHDLIASIDRSLIEAQQQPPERGNESLNSMSWAATTAWIGAQLADGLQAAHDANVLHLDIKPANVLLSPTCSPKLVDFNVSDRGISSIFQKRIGGTLPYMSPEHLNAVIQPAGADRLGQHSDLYSLAITLWELWQGERPWKISGKAESWRNAIDEQIASRQTSFECRRHDTSPEGIWLEQVLRTTLAHHEMYRPQSCREFATRLKLAYHPEMVVRFAPTDGTWASRLLKWPVVIVAGIAAFATHIPMGAINFLYNREVIVRQFNQLLPEFSTISVALNLIAFPIGAVLLVLFCWQVQRSLSKATKGTPATDFDIGFVWRFGHRAAVISGALWLTFGLVFPVVLRLIEPSITFRDFIHFFVSLSICGGIALIYPFFGISLLSIFIYYPRLISPTMRDEKFEERADWLRSRADYYLVLAAVVPLLAIGLLILMKSNAPQALQVSLVGIALVSLFVSFKAHQLLMKVLDQYSQLFK